MDISLLKTFLEVSRTRNFARAAENLFVTSAAVSARVKLLEGQLGVALFIRDRNNIRLTSEGEKLIPLAETMINTWSRALQEVSLQADMETRIHIGATPSMWALAMQSKLTQIMAKMPGVALQAEGHSNEDLAKLLLDQTLDLVILPDPPVSEAIKSEKIGEMTLQLASDEPVTRETALASDYIFVDWGTAFRNFHAKRFGELMTPVLQVNLTNIALEVIQEKGGSAYLPRSIISAEDMHLVDDAPSFKRAIYACYQQNHSSLSVIREIVASLRGISI